MSVEWKKVAITTAVLSATITSTAFAGTWKTADGGKWWYDNGNGSYTSNGWQWIDGNGDGVAESYYFDGNGYLLTNTTTPDGYTVNENGAWVLNGAIQTKTVSTTAEPIGEADFVVSGDNSVTQNNADHSVLTNWKRLGFTNEPYHAFVSGDCMTTARGITFGNTKNAVMEKYGSGTASAFSSADKLYQNLVANSQANANDVKVIGGSASVLDYLSNSYGMRFYFNAQDELIGLIYYKEGAFANSSIQMSDYVGKFVYCGAASYVYNEQTRQYEVFAQTSSANYDEWFEKIYPADLAYLGYDIKYASDEKVVLSAESDFQYLKYNGEWYYDANDDGVLQDSEKEYKGDIEFLEGGKISFSSEWYIDFENAYGWPQNSYLKVTSFYQKQ